MHVSATRAQTAQQANRHASSFSEATRLRIQRELSTYEEGGRGGKASTAGRSEGGHWEGDREGLWQRVAAKGEAEGLGEAARAVC